MIPLEVDRREPTIGDFLRHALDSIDYLNRPRIPDPVLFRESVLISGALPGEFQVKTVFKNYRLQNTL